MIYVTMTLLLGIVAGLRAMIAPAALSWAAFLGWLPLAGTWASFMGHWIAVGLFTLAAVAELVSDQLPNTPSRKVPQQFAARLFGGGLAGAVMWAAVGPVLAWAAAAGLAIGIVGAVLGTYVGAAARARLAALFGRDLPAALIEDAAAIAIAFLVVGSMI